MMVLKTKMDMFMSHLSHLMLLKETKKNKTLQDQCMDHRKQPSFLVVVGLQHLKVPSYIYQETWVVILVLFKWSGKRKPLVKCTCVPILKLQMVSVLKKTVLANVWTVDNVLMVIVYAEKDMKVSTVISYSIYQTKQTTQRCWNTFFYSS